ncbi:DEAD/DEAH box helicase [Singulisphaera sp. Ch08]|uniref:DEAD/DEAH box helicase n=1 Tax=Singulisphaera sp. Ch08 TaxID=3120278 RepID=A0AAU7CJS9_9BACT
MPINPIQIAREIESTFCRYLRTTFQFPDDHADLCERFAAALAEPARLFRGPYLHGLAPYLRDASVLELIQRGVLPEALRSLPLLSPPDRPLYRHQVAAIERLRSGRNVIVSSGTGSGKTLTFLTPILAKILEDPSPGIHALLLYPMNALVNDQLKTLRRVLREIPAVRFGRYINIQVTPRTEREGRALHPDAPANEVVSRESFRDNPPHLLITNYAMLEYLLLRADDSPLFHGPWRFVVVDEAHTYGGTKGSEVAMLLRRLVARVKAEGQTPPQCIATSATLGAADPVRRREVLEFARSLFNVPFEEGSGDDPGDLIVAEKQHAPAEGGCEPEPSIYTHPAVERACQPGASWNEELSETLKQAGFPADRVDAAALAGQSSVEEGLYETFRHDVRTLRLREAADDPHDLPSAAQKVLGRHDEVAISQLCGLVRVSSLARVPGGDARLVPCRYHFFVRGLNRGYVALVPGADRAEPLLFLEPTRETDEGLRTLELRVCRKCGQPYLYGVANSGEGGMTLAPAADPFGDPPQALWLTWTRPDRRSDDECEEGEEEEARYPIRAFHTRTGAYRDLGNGVLQVDEVRLWEVSQQGSLKTCVTCGGRQVVTRLQADSEAAQAVIADAFYRCLPEASSPPARPEALEYPGRGRKLLAFADSRQSAAYFAPYLQNTSDERVMRWLIYRACDRAASRLDGEVDANTLLSQMVRIGDEQGVFPLAMNRGQQQERCARALVAEFCLPFGRRQSLEALALIACGVDLRRAWVPPGELGRWLDIAEQETVAEVLLTTLRQVKAVELPDPLTPNDPAFGYQTGPDAFIARGSETSINKSRLHGFGPERAPHLQRRSAYLGRVLAEAAKARGVKAPTGPEVVTLLDRIWTALTSSARPVLARVQVAPGTVGHQLRWEALTFRPRGNWYVCNHCRQWSALNALGICPSFRCTGRLEQAGPDLALADHHYRRAYYLPDEGPLPLVAKEHTAQLSPKLATEYQVAFQDGHFPDVGQINVLSSSTTFELGVDLGDLEAVYLRNVPPSPANYQQRAGRAGRGIGSAAFSVTFAMTRSHDEHYYANPPQLIDGLIRSPRIELRNETLALRHVSAVLLADFVRNWARSRDQVLQKIGQILPEAQALEVPADAFLDQMADLLAGNTRAVELLWPWGASESSRRDLAARITEAFARAREHYANEMAMYLQAIEALDTDRKTAEVTGEHERARRLYNFGAMLRQRLEAFRDKDWVTYYSDRSVLPSYAFPIYNVALETPDRDLKLERDLRLALTEYVPGASIVAKGRLWRSIGIRKPWQKPLEEKWYARCPTCWHVMRHLDPNQVFPDDVCPVCHHDGGRPVRRKYRYLVPEYGFTTDLTTAGESLVFDRPQRILASRVLFVPQQQQDDPVRAYLGDGPLRVEVRSTERADFFVFNSGDEPDGMGFRLCRLCGRRVEVEPVGRGKQRRERVKTHRTPYGKDCPGEQYDRVHLGHEFISSAARLSLTGTNHPYTDQPFWLSVLYAVLGGMAEALGIDAADINGVIRPIEMGGNIGQELVIFDDVPGGAGHSLRLEGADELRRALEAARARVTNCTCGETASCYACLRSYRNQFCHESLTRGPVADYLGTLLDGLTTHSDDDLPYLLPDRSSAIRSAIRNATRLDLIVHRLDSTGPPEVGPWYLQLLHAASRAGSRVRIAVRNPGQEEGRDGIAAHLVALTQAGVELYLADPSAPSADYSLLALGPEGEPSTRSVGLRWGESLDNPPLDGQTHRMPLWSNRFRSRLATARDASDAWFAAHSRPLNPAELLRSHPGCRVHPIAKGEPVDLLAIFGALPGRIERCRMQDPYLLTSHQLDGFGAFLASVRWQPAGESIPST